MVTPPQVQARSRTAFSCNMLKKKKKLLAIYNRHDKWDHCFKAYVLFLDLGRSIVYYMLFNQVGYFVSYYKMLYILHNRQKPAKCNLLGKMNAVGYVSFPD